MKHVLILLTCFVWSYSTLASDTTIIFQQINYSDLFEKAKKENKGVMLYFHFDGCGACVSMERTAFKDKSVIDYYNTNFINFEINTLKGEGIEVNKIYNIKLHPTFIFFGNEGNELHRMVGVFSPKEFYKQANDALLSNKNLTNYKRQYIAGNRESNFLFDYTYMLRDANELDSLRINEYLNTQDTNDLYQERNIRFIYEYIIHNGKVCIPYYNSAYSFMSNNKDQFGRYFDMEQVNTRLMFVVQSEVYDAISRKDSLAFFSTIESLRKYDVGKEYYFKEMDDRITMWTTNKTLVLTAKMFFYQEIGDAIKYNEYLEQYIEHIWNDSEELNNVAWNTYLNASNNEIEKIKTAIKYSIRSIELNNNYANNDTYAWLLFKSEEKNKALKQANKAIEIAKKNKQDYSETQKLVDSITKKE